LNNKRFINILLISIVALTVLFSFIPYSEAHILVVGDSNSDITQSYQDAVTVSKLLKSKDYDVLSLYRENATTKNILKGMYGADAIIYAGHGGYQSGHYDLKGGTATPPYALVGSNDFIWGIGDKMREGWNGKLFTAPIKNNIPVIMLQACFSTGWVDDKEVANPVATVYNFARMFTGAGANYYATAWLGAQIIKDFTSGAKNFQTANSENYEKITQKTIYNNTEVWRNSHGYSAFIGNWLAGFPTVTQTTKYDDAAAEAWYKSDRSNKPFESDLNLKQVVAPSMGIKGHHFTITTIIKNLANYKSSGFYVNHYLKLSLTSPNIYLGHTFVSGLAALSITTLKTTFLVPSNIKSGKYYITSFADANRNNAETNENNNFNISSSKVLICNPSRDLVVTQISGILNGVNGNKLYISSTIKNSGSLSTTSFWLDYYIKQNGTKGLGKYVGHSYISSLSSGKSKQQNMTLTLNSNIYASKYIVVAYADSHKNIVERNETNNIKTSQIKSF
jgi:hypothetical protein